MTNETQWTEEEIYNAIQKEWQANKQYFDYELVRRLMRAVRDDLQARIDTLTAALAAKHEAGANYYLDTMKLLVPLVDENKRLTGDLALAADESKRLRAELADAKAELEHRALLLSQDSETITQLNKVLMNTQAGRWEPVPDGEYVTPEGAVWQPRSEGLWQIVDVLNQYVDVDLPDGWQLRRRVAPAAGDGAGKAESDG